MKRNPNFLLRDVAGTKVIVPVGEAVAGFPGMMTVNDCGAYIWELLENEQTVASITDALTQEYDVSRETALVDTEAFVAKLRNTGAITD